MISAVNQHGEIALWGSSLGAARAAVLPPASMRQSLTSGSLEALLSLIDDAQSELRAGKEPSAGIRPWPALQNFVRPAVLPTNFEDAEAILNELNAGKTGRAPVFTHAYCRTLSELSRLHASAFAETARDTALRTADRLLALAEWERPPARCSEQYACTAPQFTSTGGKLRGTSESLSSEPGYRGVRFPVPWERRLLKRHHKGPGYTNSLPSLLHKAKAFLAKLVGITGGR